MSAERARRPARDRTRRFRLLVSLALVLVATACRERPPAAAHRNVLLLVVDALRPDHLGVHGYPRATSPRIDRLAAAGTDFRNARAASHFTRASVPSIFTGVYPSTHGIFDLDQRLSDELETLAEILRARGYATAAYMPNPSLRAELNFGQGFEVYDDRVLMDQQVTTRHEEFETARRIQERALRFLDQNRDRPYFLYLHYRDVHGPYVPPPDYSRQFWDPERAAADPATRWLTRAERGRMKRYLRDPADLGSRDFYVAQYDADIRYTDDRLAEFLEQLERTGRLDDTLVLLTADHGEAFLEHGQWEHGATLFDEELRVPLIVVEPGRTGAGRVVEQPVQSVDLLPTILDFAGVTKKPEQCQGRSLMPLLRGGQLAAAPGFAMGDEGRMAVWDDGWKLLLEPKQGGWLLFDLAADPRESTNRLESEPEQARRLRLLLKSFLDASAPLAQKYSPTRRKLGEPAADDLRALGYL